MKAEQLTGPVCAHAEGPVYSDRWRALRFVDMLSGSVLELDDQTGRIERREIRGIVAMIRPRQRPGWVIATARGLALADDDALDATLSPGPELFSAPELRLNEGGCDPAGNLYVGSMAYDQSHGAGTLYRIDPDGVITTAIESVSVSNGLAWSPAGTRAYYADTPTGRVDVFDWTADDGLAGRRRFADLPSPDGLAIDSEGGVWAASFGTGTVSRFRPGGELDEVIELPVRQVTAVAFAGDKLDRLIITTSRHDLTDPEDGAGALFVAHPGVRGQPVLEFAG